MSYQDEILDPIEAENEADSRDDNNAGASRKDEGSEMDTSAPVVDTNQLALQELCGHDPLTPEEEKRLFAQISAYPEGSPEWKEAYEAIVKGNMRMVVQIVGKKYSKSITPAMSFWDMVQEGYLAIDKCIRKFDATRSNKFSTYAWPAISRDILRAIAAKATPLSSIGSSKYLKMRRTMAIRSAMMSEAGAQNPSIADLAKKTGYAVDDVKEYMRLAAPTLSLEQTISNEADDAEDTDLKNFLPDESVNVEKTAIDHADSEKLREYAKKYLDERAYTIIDGRFFRTPAVPISDLAEQLGCTPQNIHTIKCSALALLKYLLQNDGAMPPWRVKAESTSDEPMAPAASSAAMQEQGEEEPF